MQTVFHSFCYSVSGASAMNEYSVHPETVKAPNTTRLLPVPPTLYPTYSRSCLNGHSRKRTALLYPTYSRSSLNRHSRKQTALLTAALTKTPFLPGSAYKLCIYSFWYAPAPVTNSILASRGCPLTGALTVFPFGNSSKTKRAWLGFKTTPFDDLFTRHNVE